MTLSATIERITPELARSWLPLNTINRNVRAAYVKYVATLIRTSRFVCTTDGVGFRASDGALVNGQHRLLAIILANQAVDLPVVRGLSDEAFQVIDRGQRRSLNDVLHLPNKLLADASLIWNIMQEEAPGRRIAEQDVEDTAAWWSPAHDMLETAYRSRAKGLDNAPVRVAFGARWASARTVSDRTYLVNQYAAMMVADTTRMSRSTASLWKRLIQQKYGSASEKRLMTAAVTFYHMDPVRAQRDSRFGLMADGIVVKELRDVLMSMETAYLAAPIGSDHPYHFGKRLAA